MRSAVVTVRGFTAVFDGRTFVCPHKLTQSLLNRTLKLYNTGALGKTAPAQPDPLRATAKDVAEAIGGELVSCDPIDYSEIPDGVIF